MPGASGEKEIKDKEKESSSTSSKSAKKRVRVRTGDGEGNPEQDETEEIFALAEEEVDGATPERRDTFERSSATDDEAKAKRNGVLYETIVKQEKKIRALQNDLKELRTLLLSVVDKQSTFSRQLRHLSGGAGSDGLVIDEDDDDDNSS